jgi:hypothetical protein
MRCLHCWFGPVPDIGSSGGNRFEVVAARSKKVRLLEFNEPFLINAINKDLHPCIGDSYVMLFVERS